jgi:acyl transferase domain-containing protein/thioesterase domain-containing protein/acyl carrier protein
MSNGPEPDNRIAIVGQAARLPSARNVAQFWEMLAAGRIGTTQLTDEALLAAGVSRAKLADPNYVKAANIMPDMECFDAGFWGFSPKEASILDPQHRHFLECAWEALEDAGHMPESFDGRIGVFAGSGMQAYMPFNLLTNPDLVEEIGLFLLRHTGNDKDFLTTRLSYLLNLQGPSVAVQTACSTSLVAAHAAVNSLLSMESDMAIAGGVTIELPHHVGYTYEQGEIMSRDGLCRAFDDDSTGTVFGSGAALVVMRRLEDALEDGDDIKAVILASAINNDGAQKANYLAPSVDGQADAVAEAVELAGIEPDSVSYIEAHGTGTNIGDPIELTALGEVYSGAPGSVGIGSVKTNIGHIDTAAGAASLIKVVEALRHKRLPASLNFKTPNSRFDFAASPFFVVDEARDWAKGATPRRAAVNSLGVGGTNAHMIVEEAPERTPADQTDCWRIFPFSARTQTSLNGVRDNWAGVMTGSDAPALWDVAYTLRHGRRVFDKRMGLVARSAADLEAALAGKAPSLSVQGSAEGDTPPQIVFLFPGGGAQYPGAGADLLAASPVFKSAVDACFTAIPDTAPDDLYEVMFERDISDEAARKKLGASAYAIPALFILEYSYAKLWEDWGVKPDAILAHSVGEYAGAVVAGSMSLADAMQIVTLRGKVMDAAPKGAMTSVPANEEKLRALIGDDLDIAALNGPDLSVVSGRRADIEALEKKLKDTDLEANRIHIDVAAHSRVLDGQLEPFRKGFEGVAFQKPAIPFVSSMRGDWGQGEDFASAEYWVQHLRSTVRFVDAAATILDTPNRIILEVGPGQTLGPLIDMMEGENKPKAVLYSGSKPRDDSDDLGVAMTALAGLWANGVEIDWDRLPGQKGRRVSLPTYAFEKTRHWIEPGTGAASTAIAQSAIEISRIEGPENWFCALEWSAAPHRAGTTDLRGDWLVFAGDDPVSEAMLDTLSLAQANVRIVRMGESFAALDDISFSLRADAPEDYEALLNALGTIPPRIAHLWPLSAATQAGIFDSAFCLLRAMQLADVTSDTRLIFAAHGLGPEVADPSAATLLGPVRVVPREIPGLRTALVDLDPQDDPQAGAQALIEDITGGDTHDYLAMRGATRLAQTRSPLASTSPDIPPERLRKNGVYVITGGMGGIGRALALYLGQTVSAKVAIISRSATGDAQLQAQIADAGGQVGFFAADVTDKGALAGALEAIAAEFGPINGVFHGAGLIDDAPLSVKELASAHKVMAPKTDGGAHLNALLPDGALDLFAVFSSSSVVLGSAGQTDYIAANAYLEALAASRADGLSIAWGIWRDIGMAADTYGAKIDRLGAHPLLGQRTEGENGEICFVTGIDPQNEWVLAEHVVGGEKILPGVAYIDLAYEAARHVVGDRNFELKALSLISPMLFPKDMPRQIEVRLAPVRDGFDLIIGTNQGPGAPISEHARAHVLVQTRIDSKINPKLKPNPNGLELSDKSFSPAQESMIAFGPRWSNIGEIRIGEDIVEGQFALGEDFIEDINAYPIHPALMDNAATVGLYLLPDAGQDGIVYAPISAERIRIFDALPQHVVARAIKVSGNVARFASFDVLISDLMGRALISIEGLAMRGVEDGLLKPAQSEHRLTETLLANGICAEDAPEVFSRALNTSQSGLVVSSIALETIRAAMAEPPKRAQGAKKRDPQKQSSGNPVEAWLEDVWCDLLGLETARAEDDFFALGGHSLNAVRMFGQIRKKYSVDLPLATLFEAPTLGAIARLVVEKGDIDIGADTPAPAQAPADWSPLVPIKKGTSTALPLYCVHGAGGNVLNFRSLSGYLDNDIAFFGLRALGSDGGLEIDTSIEAMASRYLEAIRAHQPVGPYRLAGYSGGGVVAYEMAQQLKRDGEKVSHLIFFDTLVPAITNQSVSFAQKLWAARKWDVKFALDWWQRRARARDGADNARQIDKLLEQGTPLPSELIGQRMTAAYMAAEGKYLPDPYDGDITIFRAKRASTEFLIAGPQLGWEDYVTGTIDVKVFNCDHFSMMSDPTIGEIGDIINGMFQGTS